MNVVLIWWIVVWEVYFLVYLIEFNWILIVWLDLNIIECILKLECLIVEWLIVVFI